MPAPVLPPPPLPPPAELPVVALPPAAEPPPFVGAAVWVAVPPELAGLLPAADELVVALALLDDWPGLAAGCSLA